MILALPGTVIGLPDFTTRFGLSLADRGLFIATLFGSLLVGSAVSGAIVDHVGHRRSVGWSAAALALLLPVFATAGSYPLALGALAGIGIASAPLNTAANALSSELFPAERGRRMTQIAIAFSSGGLLLPAVTAAAADVVSWRAVVVGGAVLAAATALASLRAADVPTPPREGSLGSALAFFRRPGFVLCCALLVCGAANEGAFAGWTSSYLSASGLTPVAATVGLSSHWLGLLVGRALFAARVDRNKRAGVIRGALSGAAILTAMIASPTSGVLAVGPFAAGVAIAVVVPAALALAGDRFPGNSGTLFGVLLTMAQVGGMTLPPLIGAAAQATSLRVALTLAVANALTIAVLGWRAGAASPALTVTGKGAA